jgi:hypothetical protein
LLCFYCMHTYSYYNYVTHFFFLCMHLFLLHLCCACTFSYYVAPRLLTLLGCCLTFDPLTLLC